MSAVQQAINAATSFTDAQLSYYLVNTVAVSLASREFWNPRQPDVYAALVAKRNSIHTQLEAQKTELGVRVSNQVANIVKLAQAKANLAAANVLLASSRVCEQSSPGNPCPIGQVKYQSGQSDHEIDFDCNGAYDGQYGGYVRCDPLVTFGSAYLGYYAGYDNYYAYDPFCVGSYTYKKMLGCSTQLYGNWATGGRLTNGQVTVDTNCDGTLDTTMNAIGCIGSVSDASLNSGMYVSDVDIDCSGSVDTKATANATSFTGAESVYSETLYRRLKTDSLPQRDGACATEPKWSTVS